MTPILREWQTSPLVRARPHGASSGAAIPREWVNAGAVGGRSSRARHSPRMEALMAAIITMLNLKGGVGKSTCTFHLGCTLATTGRRVLLVDNDPQTSLTQ